MRRSALSPVLAVLVVLAVVVSSAPVFANEKLGKVHFPTSCAASVQPAFDRAVALLHSFWLDAAGKAFAGVAQNDPGCAMAHWGTAMVLLGNPLAGARPPKVLKEGMEAVERAKNVGAGTARERDYIAAIEAFYRDHERLDHRARSLAYEKAMEAVAQRYPQDTEATVFYALALQMTIVPTDKTYANQLKSAGLLEKIFAQQPNHPGVAHYLIHAYDFPPIANKGLGAARRYAGIAPSSAHARHMPSHVFTRVGAWQESIESNRASAEVADGPNKHHAFDYMLYGYLQLGQDGAAQRVVEELRTVQTVDVQHPLAFASAFAIAAGPARYALERRRWNEAATLTLPPTDLEWARFPQAEAIVVFARGLGAARSGNVATARQDLERLGALQTALVSQKQGYWAGQADIQRQIISAWIARAEGRHDEALKLMRTAADAEDATEKHIVTPGPIVPARELLGEMLLEANRPAEALKEFEASQAKEPNRFRGFYGAARAASLAGDRAKARDQYAKLVTLAERADSDRPEIREAKGFLGKP
jgi:tetratricopeptide (TPR) repeat protein